LVEPFQVSVKEDILHAFEVEKKAIRHFRISRIERVELQMLIGNTKHNIM
jgi:predicted DNA-binding transcriptional regulator YafY